jgi:hypothetical protein
MHEIGNNYWWLGLIIVRTEQDARVSTAGFINLALFRGQGSSICTMYTHNLDMLIHFKSKNRSGTISVVDPDSLNPDPDMVPAFQVNTDPDTDPGFLQQIGKCCDKLSCCRGFKMKTETK